MIKIGIAGAAGRMGKRIAALAAADNDVKIASALERSDSPEAGKDLGKVIGTEDLGVTITGDLDKACSGIDCLIDFTLPGPTMEHVEACEKNKVSMVIGTTGLSSREEDKVKGASGVIPVVFSPNMAVGVNLLFNIVKEAARVLGQDFDIKVDETHHVHKKDSPSGTAKRIAQVITEASGKEPPIEAFREGEVIGNHGIILDGEYEQLEIRHDAKNRDVFAAGAIKAAKFIAGKAPGLYSMADVLGLS
ncbi:MAG: 4-hydroxy-tetrahydrodipicolinate reductase [Candidatus Omnitrophica bacterium]|nr:4-hydroxy-tetrahydrodipicolinate reductase [Candidatus Omnitrophota bacterium]